jgi:hypothetical protein
MSALVKRVIFTHANKTGAELGGWATVPANKNTFHALYLRLKTRLYLWKDSWSVLNDGWGSKCELQVQLGRQAPYNRGAGPVAQWYHSWKYRRGIRSQCYGFESQCHPPVWRGQRVAGGELRHLTGFPGGGGDMGLCHTLIRVHTVWIKQNKAPYNQNYDHFDSDRI